MSNNAGKSRSPSSKGKYSEPKKQISLAEYEEQKLIKLERLKQESLHNKRMWQDMGTKTRMQQIEKAKQMTRGNPLAVDQSAFYSKNIERLQAKYVTGKKL